MSEELKNPRGFVKRQIVAGKTIGIRGYGVEILDGGIAGGNNVLLLERESVGADVSFSGDGSMRCFEGARLLAQFDALTLVDPIPASASKDGVLVKVITDPRCVWTDSDPSGCARARFLTRSNGPLTIGAGLFSQIYAEAATVPETVRYWTDERFDSRGVWHGAVLGDQPFDLYVYSKLNPSDVTSSYRQVQRFISRDTGGGSAAAVAASIGGLTGQALTFDTGTLANNSVNSGPRAPFPAGSLVFFIENRALASGTFEWALGYRGF